MTIGSSPPRLEAATRPQAAPNTRTISGYLECCTRRLLRARMRTRRSSAIAWTRRESIPGVKAIVTGDDLKGPR